MSQYVFTFSIRFYAHHFFFFCFCFSIPFVVLYYLLLISIKFSFFISWFYLVFANACCCCCCCYYWFRMLFVLYCNTFWHYLSSVSKMIQYNSQRTVARGNEWARHRTVGRGERGSKPLIESEMYILMQRKGTWDPVLYVICLFVCSFSFSFLSLFVCLIICTLFTLHFVDIFLDLFSLFLFFANQTNYFKRPLAATPVIFEKKRKKCWKEK